MRSLTCNCQAKDKPNLCITEEPYDGVQLCDDKVFEKFLLIECQYRFVILMSCEGSGIDDGGCAQLMRNINECTRAHEACHAPKPSGRVAVKLLTFPSDKSVTKAASVK